MSNNTLSNEHSNNLLILTVGTGIDGPKTADLVQGLRRTVELLEPRKFWLVPSIDEMSQSIADKVAADFKNFSPFSAKEKYHSVQHPDDLENCRTTVREIIYSICNQLNQQDVLYINPTSGTKAMSAGATVATLDARIGTVIFTIGERVGGLVKTGTERIYTFDSSTYLYEHDYQLACSLFSQGAFYAAAQLLKPYEKYLPNAYNTAELCRHWKRLDYSMANKYDVKLPAQYGITQRTKSDEKANLLVIGDLLAWAKFGLKTKNSEEATRLSHKAIEHSIHAILEFDHGINANRIFFRDCIEKLKELGREDIVKGLEINKIWDLIYARNQSIHEIRPISLEKSQKFVQDVELFFSETLPALQITKLPEELPLD